MMSLPIQSTTTTTNGGALAVVLVVYAVIIVFFIAVYWKIFTKANQPGWAAIIPFYNIYIMLKVVGRPGWWIILFLIPIVNLIMFIIVAIDLATSFGRGGGFAVGIILLSIIFLPILAFGPATYAGPRGKQAMPGGYPAPPGYPPPPSYPPS